MRQSEHIYYKIWVNKDSIESRLLELELYDFYPAENEDTEGIEEPKKEPKGEFVRFTDSLAYGLTSFPHENAPQIALDREYRGSGGCGLYTVYDVSGDDAKVKAFRAKVYCSAESPPVETWKQYPAKQRAKWRVVPNPQREEWKSSPLPFETRCGWYNNPSTDYISVLDREGEWFISEPNTYEMKSEWDRPVFKPEQKVKTNAGDEKGCVCMDVKASWHLRRILEIKNIRIKAPDVCRQDPGLKRWKQRIK